MALSQQSTTEPVGGTTPTAASAIALTAPMGRLSGTPLVYRYGELNDD